MNDIIIRKQSANNTTLNQLQRWQVNSSNSQYSYLTLSSSEVQTTVPSVTQMLLWDFELFNSSLNDVNQSPFVWSGSSITIPQEGYYVLSLQIQFDGPCTKTAWIYVNGIAMDAINDSYNSNIMSVSFLRFFAESDILEIGINTSVNVAIVSNVYNDVNESPILNVVFLR